MSPTICCAIPIEPEFEERLRAAGDLRAVDGRAPRAELLEAVRETDGILLSPALNVDEAFLDAAPSCASSRVSRSATTRSTSISSPGAASRSATRRVSSTVRSPTSPSP